MQQHTLVAGECLREIEQRLGASNFLQTAREIAMHHHERWNGTGYPLGLEGENIPLAARIVSIADVYDALSSKRCYKSAYPHDDCVRMIREGSGTHFDPELVDAFLVIEDEFAAIAKRFSTETAPAFDVSSEPESTGTAQTCMTETQESILRNVLVTSSTCDAGSESTTSVA
jgi:putative two-component system response regulator